MMWPFSYIRNLLERNIVVPLAAKYTAQIQERVAEGEMRLEKSIEGHKAKAKADLSALVGSAAAGLTTEFQNLKSNFGILNGQFDRHMKDVDAKVEGFIESNTVRIDGAVQNVNSLIQSSTEKISQAEASYDDARKALEEMKTAFESAKKEALDLQTQYKLDYAAFQASAKSVQESISELECKVNGFEAQVNKWSIKAHELLSVDLTAERLERAQENGSKLLKSINDARDNIRDYVLDAVREELIRIADNRSFEMLVYYENNIPENMRSNVVWIADRGFKYVRSQFYDGNARAWIDRFEKDVKEKNMNLKYLAAIVKLIGYRQKNFKQS